MADRICTYCESTQTTELVLDVHDQQVRTVSCGRCLESTWRLNGHVVSVEDAIGAFRSVLDFSG